MTPVEVAALGQPAEGTLRGLLDEHARLERTPATLADVMLGRLRPGFDFAKYDATVKALDTACKKDGNALFDGRDGLTSLRGLRDQFRDALALVEPYRSVAP